MTAPPSKWSMTPKPAKSTSAPISTYEPAASLSRFTHHPPHTRSPHCSPTPIPHSSSTLFPMMRTDLVSVEKFYTDHGGGLGLKLVAGADGMKRPIREPTVNRPGLTLSGFTRYFAKNRVQVMGNAEAYYVKSLPQEERVKRYETFFAYRVPCVVFSRQLSPDRHFLRAAEAARTPIFRCPLVTMK